MSPIDLNADVNYDFTPMEYVDVPLYATIGDLKIAVQNAFRDTYCVLETLRVTEILELEGVEDEEVLFGLVESGMELRVKGCGLDLEVKLKTLLNYQNFKERKPPVVASERRRHLAARKRTIDLYHATSSSKSHTTASCAAFLSYFTIARTRNENEAPVEIRIPKENEEELRTSEGSYSDESS